MSNEAKGAMLGLGAAILFGMATPAAKVLLQSMGPVTLAALLYLGGGVGISLLRLSHGSQEAPLRGRDYGVAALILVLGGILAPIFMLLGLRGTSALAASLLLNLEGPLTVGLAALFFREHLGQRAGLAVLFVFAGTFLLAYLPGAAAEGNAWPAVLSLAAACACWAMDNNLTQRLSLKNPVAIVQIKTLGAGAVNLLLAQLLRESTPAGWVVVGAMCVGFLGYGISILLDTYALRALGAAREAAFFATAPFLGALGSFLFLGDRFGTQEAAAFVFMTAGVALLLRERHEHRHVHDPMEHEHLHVHDEHHQHTHEGTVTEPHSHWHRHERLVHSHLHVPDVHHRHRH